MTDQVGVLIRQIDTLQAKLASERERFDEALKGGELRLHDALDRAEKAEALVVAHHAAHVMRRQPGDVCPVCSPAVPLPLRYGDEVPASFDLADLCQAAVRRAEKAEQERDAFVAVLDPENRNVVGAMANAQKLQADLNAVLDWIEHDEEESIPPAGLWDRVKTLLAKREARNGRG